MADRGLNMCLDCRRQEEDNKGRGSDLGGVAR